MQVPLFMRFDPDISFHATNIDQNAQNQSSVSFEARYNIDIKNVISEFEPAVFAVPPRLAHTRYAHSNSIYKSPDHCILNRCICGMNHMDMAAMAFHHELAQNSDSQFITKFDNLSCWSNAFYLWNIYSWSFKSHILTYYGIYSFNTVHINYAHSNFIVIAIQYI